MGSREKDKPCYPLTTDDQNPLSINELKESPADLSKRTGKKRRQSKGDNGKRRFSKRGLNRSGDCDISEASCSASFLGENLKSSTCLGNGLKTSFFEEIDFLNVDEHGDNEPGI
jgi:hypothetical protein